MGNQVLFSPLILSCVLHPSLLSPLKLARLGIRTKGSIRKRFEEKPLLFDAFLANVHIFSVQTAKGGITTFSSCSSH